MTDQATRKPTGSPQEAHRSLPCFVFATPRPGFAETLASKAALARAKLGDVLAGQVVAWVLGF